jgi:hypothetical protein
MAETFYVDCLTTAGGQHLKYPNGNFPVVTKADHEKVAARADEVPLLRSALGNLVAALMRKQPPMIDQPDIEFALREARKVLGFPFDRGAE